jgi:hypothetical protein
MASNGSDRVRLLRAGGGLSIWAGLFEIVSGVALVVSTEFLSGIRYMLRYLLPELLSTYMGVPFLVLGIIAIVGGVSALRRKSFGLSLAGAICALPAPGFVIGAILAIIFVAQGKREFGARK